MNKKLEALLKKKELQDVEQVLYDKLEEWQEAEYKPLSENLNKDIALLDFVTIGEAEKARNYIVWSDIPFEVSSPINYSMVSSKWILEQLERVRSEFLFPCRVQFNERESVNGMTYYIMK